ncbi:hypothetical protein J2W27_004374 [Variovorax boronicumulans]|uniref:hypothetical protein n=1 Tax=Variovorax boronicumulans TaxID=436515 RepID=UPI002781321D|nr:hypothetical protein [Variovorax boronicumulans]MDP9912248.1 hypothetical protein [Variovorax boronicumulans]
MPSRRVAFQPCAAWRRAVAVTLAGLLLPGGAAQAVITTTLLSLSGNRITLRVGSAGGTIDNVTFVVTGANIQPSPAPVARPDTVTILLTADKALLALTVNTARLTATPAIGLACTTSSTCGGTTIPFSAISWVSTNPDASGQDIQSGTFNATGSPQQIAQFPLPLLSILSARTQMNNALRFSYANSTVYPSGVYTGRVMFTATMF